MSKINRPPIGLQGFLGSQNFGTNPSELGQLVRPTIEITPFLGVHQLRTANIVGTKTGDGLIAELTVGLSGLRVDAAWYVLGWSVLCEAPTIASDNRCFVAVDNLISNVGRAHVLGESGQQSVDANSRFAWGQQIDYPVILEPGAVLQFFWAENTALTTENVQVSVMYYELPA